MTRHLEAFAVATAVAALLGASVGALPPLVGLVLCVPAIGLSAPRASLPVAVAAVGGAVAAAPLARDGRLSVELILTLLEVAALVAVLRTAARGLRLPGWGALRTPAGLAFASTPFLLLGSIPFARAVAGPSDPAAAIGASRGFSIAAPLSPTSPLVLLTTAAAGVSLGRYLVAAAPVSLGLLVRECARSAGWTGVRQALLAAALAAPVFPAVAAGVALVPALSPVQLLLIAGLVVVAFRRPGGPVTTGDEWALFGTAGLVSAVAVGHDLAGVLARSVFSVAGPVLVVAIAGALAFGLYQIGVHPVLGAPVIAASAAQLVEGSVAVVLAVVVCGAAGGTVSRFSGQAQLARTDRRAAPYWQEQGSFAVSASMLAIGWGLLVTTWT